MHALHLHVETHWYPKFANGLKCLSRHRSKSIWVTILLFCHNDSLMGGSIWQKNRMVTHILFDLCPFKHFSMSQIFVISLYIEHSKWFLTWLIHVWFLIARLARSDPRNHFVAKNILSAVCSNFRVFHHVFISCLDMFKNCINSYHIDSEQV